MAIRFDEIQLASDGSHQYPTLSNSGGNGLRIHSATGYGDFGSGNTSYFHISTDRGSFYFSKSISSDGHLSAYGGDENLTNWNNVDASAFRSKANTAYLLDPDNTGTSLNVAGTGTFAGSVVTPSVFTQNMYITSSGTTSTNRIDNDGTQLYLTYGGASSRALEILNSNGNATFAGTVTWSGGGSANANTAYGWGNHASAGYLTSSGTVAHATNLNATDDRDMAPEDLGYSNDLRVFFSTKEGMEAGSGTGTDYQDVLYLNSYSDSSGGAANCLAFDKSSGTYRILHYQAAQSASNWGTAKTIAYTSDIPTDFVSAANGGTFAGGLTISGSIDSGGTDMGYYQSAGTNIILKGDSNGRSGIFFESEKDGTNINDPSDYGFIQFHAYGYGNTSGESAGMVIGVANDSADKLILQTPYNGGVMVGYKDATGGTGLTLSEVIHSNASSYNNGNWDTAYGWGNHASAGYLTSSHNHAASDITSGTFAAARIAHNSFDIGDTTAETGRNVHETGIYTFNVNNNNLGTGTDQAYYSVLGFGQGTGGSAQIAAKWTSSGEKLYYRSLRDTTDNWWSWKEIYHTGHKPTYLELGTMDYSNLSDTPTIPTNNNQLTNGAGYLTSFDITSQTDSKYLRTDVADAAAGRISFNGCNTNNHDTIATSTGSLGAIEIYNAGSGNDAFMTFHVGGDYACYFGLDGGTNKLSVGGWSMGAASYEIYHAGNKPSLSTLGYTGATNANYITNNNQLTNGAGYITSSSLGVNCTFSADSANGDNMSTRKASGFYETSTPTGAEGWPTNTQAGNSSWMHLISATHSNDSNYYAMQIAGGFFNQGLYHRNTNSSGTTGWLRIAQHNDSTVIAGEWIRADKFYTYNDTTRYVDPANTSLMNNVNVYGLIGLNGYGNFGHCNGSGGNMLGFKSSNGAGATLGVNKSGQVYEYEKIFTFKVSGSGWVNRSSNPYKLIQAPGADKMIVVDEFLVYIDYATRTGLGSSGIGLSYEQAAYSVGFYLNETGQAQNTAAHGVGGTFYTAGIMPGGFMNSTLDRGYYRDVPVHQSALIANRSLFFKTSRNCSSSSNAPGGAHYIKIKYRVIDISDEFSDSGTDQTISSSSYHGQYAHSADGQKQYTDSGGVNC